MSLKETMKSEQRDCEWVFKENCLDFIRLLAALQVMVLHSFEFTMHSITHSLFFEIIRLFPGVPIFFFISGYLITRSYERAPNLMSYFRNRVLRIFPALMVCVFLNLLLVASTGYFAEKNVSFFDVTVLYLAKTTIFQFYNPDFMRSFGDGVLNGSLWTICVELQFYIVTPILYKLFSLKKDVGIGKIIAIMFFLVFANRLLYLTIGEYGDSIVWKLYRVSFIPWLYMFLTGFVVQRYFTFFSKFLENISTSKLVLSYTVFALVLLWANLNFGNSIPPYVFFPLVIVVFRLSYFKPNFFNRLLRGNDISYGIYIWHMPFINQLLYLDSEISAVEVIKVLLLTVIVAFLSWVLLEKRILRLKSFSLKSVKG